MESRQKFVRLAIGGGLGNQLFQLATAMYFAKEADIVISDKLLPVRRNSDGQPEVFSFKLSDKFLLDPNQSKRFSYLVAIRIILRTANSGTHFSNFFRKLAELVIKISEGGSMNNCETVIVSETSQREIASSPQSLQMNMAIIGYFQSPIWMSDESVVQELNSIIQVDNSPNIAKMNRLAKIEKPLVVHVRLTDYLKNSNFGVPSLEYYLHGIEKIWEQGLCEKIWLFSDDLEDAVKFIPGKFDKFLRLMEPKDLSTVETFETMRLGEGFVIANSSFSWWAAFLRHNQVAPVVVPEPWFKGMVGQKINYPGDWIPINAHSSN